MSGLRLAIIGSTRGTVMLPIITAIKQRQLAASLECVISNKKTAVILERARAALIPTLFIDPHGLTRADYDALLSAELHRRNIDLIILIGYMRILSADFVSAWKNKIINIHPSLLPEFAGGMNNDVHAAVLKAGKKTTGCTVHFVTAEVDAGPILLQKSCEVLAMDTVETLKTRVQKLEGQALIEVITHFTVIPAQAGIHSENTAPVAATMNGFPPARE